MKFSLMFLLSLVLIISGCSDGDDDSGSTDSDADTDADGDSDSDSDTDTDSDSDADESFSFFAISLEYIQEHGGSEGFGGDLGGLDGADAHCQAAAEAVGSSRTWRAFLSVTDYNGTGPVNAIDRIGQGPWYDVNGYLLAENIEGLLNTRPDGDTDPVYNDGWQDWPFISCLTTELGNCTLSYGDSHDTLTGSDRDGELFSTDPMYTCHDWTSTNVNEQIPVGHTWQRHLDDMDPDTAHWIQAHYNCNEGPFPTGDCNGCAANINFANAFEEGVGGDGGYGGWYCFAID